MRVRAYRPCTTHDIESARARALAVCRAWAVDWADVATLGVEVEPLTAKSSLPGADDSTLAWYGRIGTHGQVWASGAAAVLLAQTLFGGERPDPRRADGLALGVARQALGSLLAGLAGTAAGEGAELVAAPAPVHLAEPGRAALLQRIRVGSVAIDVMAELPAHVPPAPLAKRSFAHSLTASLTGQPVPVRAVLGQAEVELGVLQSLAVGDVVRLDGRLDDSIALWAGDQRLPCNAYLGSIDGHLAVEVARP